MSEKRALITGICGQDASYLAELLLSKGYKVFGTKRRTSGNSTKRISHILKDITLIDADLADSSSLIEAIKISKPDEVYNLAAQSFVASSFKQPEHTANITGLGALRILDAIKNESPNTRLLQASSSEMFSNSVPPQNENSIFHPRSPYGCAKLFAFWATVNYREAYNIHASNSICYNHEGPRRGSEVVTKKIAQGVAAIKFGKMKKLSLGNLEARRDWGHAKDFVEAMWMMLQQEIPDDYVICTGIAHSVREFADLAFKTVGLNYLDYVEIDEKFKRPAEVNFLLGDYSKAKEKLGWKPKTSFEELVSEMVECAMSNPNDWM